MKKTLYKIKSQTMEAYVLAENVENALEKFKEHATKHWNNHIATYTSLGPDYTFDEKYIEVYFFEAIISEDYLVL